MRVEPRPSAALRGLALACALALAAAVPAAAQDAAAPAAAAARPAPMLTGEVRALEAEAIRVPRSNSNPVTLRTFLEDGASVAVGDLVLAIDPGQGASALRAAEQALEVGEARAAKELAELEVLRIDAELALVDAEAALATAEVDAAVPADLLRALDADRYRGELERATRELALKRSELATAEAALARRREDARLEREKLTAQRDYHAGFVSGAEVRATRAGTLRRGFDPRGGQRYEEGSSANVGQQVAEIVIPGAALEVVAWVHEADRAAIAPGMDAEIAFDALPGARARGRVERIAGAPETRAQWGRGGWFELRVSLADDHGLALRPGMSARVAPRAPSTEASE